MCDIKRARNHSPASQGHNVLRRFKCVNFRLLPNWKTEYEKYRWQRIYFYALSSDHGRWEICI